MEAVARALRSKSWALRKMVCHVLVHHLVRHRRNTQALADTGILRATALLLHADDFGMCLPACFRPFLPWRPSPSHLADGAPRSGGR